MFICTPDVTSIHVYTCTLYIHVADCQYSLVAQLNDISGGVIVKQRTTPDVNQLHLKGAKGEGRSPLHGTWTANVNERATGTGTHVSVCTHVHVASDAHSLDVNGGQHVLEHSCHEFARLVIPRSGEIVQYELKEQTT